MGDKDTSSGKLDGLRELFKRMHACAKADPVLFKLYENAAEYARAYLLARERQKGCDGMGMMTTMKEDFMCALDALLQRCHSQELSYNGPAFEIDIDWAAEELERMEKS